MHQTQVDDYTAIGSIAEKKRRGRRKQDVQTDVQPQDALLLFLFKTQYSSSEGGDEARRSE